MKKKIIISDALLDIDFNYSAKDKNENEYMLHIEDVAEGKYVIKILNFRIVDWRDDPIEPKVLASNW
jgi:hypothetical protein